MTFPLPRGCSTAELCGRTNDIGKDDNGCAAVVINFCGQGGNRTPERHRRADLQSASFGHLDTCPFVRAVSLNQPRADDESRTRNLPITNRLLRRLSYVGKRKKYADLLARQDYTSGF